MIISAEVYCDFLVCQILQAFANDNIISASFGASVFTAEIHVRACPSMIGNPSAPNAEPSRNSSPETMSATQIPHAPTPHATGISIPASAPNVVSD